MFSKITKWILLFAKELISMAVMLALAIGIILLLTSVCKKKPKPVTTNPAPVETTHTTPIIGNANGHTHIVIPIVHRDTTLPPGLQMVARESVIVDIDQDVTGKITITSKPDFVVGHVTINKIRPALIRIKPSLSAYAGFCGSITAGVAVDVIEVWKLSAGADVGVRNIGRTPLALDAGVHATYNLNKHVGLMVGRTWKVYKGQGDPKWMLGASVRLI